MEEIIKLIKKRMERRSLKQKELAELVGWTESRMSIFLAGNANITMRYFVKICRILDIKIS